MALLEIIAVNETDNGLDMRRLLTRLPQGMAPRDRVNDICWIETVPEAVVKSTSWRWSDRHSDVILTFVVTPTPAHTAAWDEINADEPAWDDPSISPMRVAEHALASLAHAHVTTEGPASSVADKNPSLWLHINRFATHGDAREEAA